MFFSLYKWLIRLGKVAGGITLFVGAIVWIVEYRGKIHDERIAKALSVYDDFAKEPYVGMRFKINRVLILERTRMEESLKGRSNVGFNDLIREIVHKNDIENELNFVFQHFELVSYCVSKDICDAETTLGLFQNIAVIHWRMFYGYIIDGRNNSSPTLAVGLESMAKFKLTN